MFKIGDFSKLTLVSIRMLRYYDEIDLFKPMDIDSFTNYRYYSAGQIPTLKKIVYLRNLGFKADDIRLILNEADPTKQKQFLQDKKRDILQDMKLQEWRLNEIDKFIRNYHKEEARMKYDVIIRSIPSYQVCSLRKTIPTYMDEGELWQEYMQLVHTHKIQLKPTGMCYALFFNDDYVEHDVDIEIGNEVTQSHPSVDGLVYKTIEPIDTAATLLVAGSYYPNIEKGFEFLAKWLEEHNYAIAGPSKTVYIKGPTEEQNPDNYLTEIILPVKQKVDA